MKKFSRSVSSILALGAAALLSLLGQSCSNVTPAEYGTPHADFEVKSKVTNNAEQAVEGIEVTVQKGAIVKSAKTDANGKVDLIIRDIPDNQPVTIVAKDVDGPANGEYETNEQTIGTEGAQFEGGNGWYEGKTTINADVVLKEKTK